MSDKEYFADFPKLTVLPWLVWALIAVAIIGALYAGRAIAAEPALVYEDPQMRLRLLDKPCLYQEVLKHIRPQIHELYKEGELIWEGRALRACWRPTEEKAVRTVDEEGDQLQPDLPMQAFKKDIGA